MTQSIAERALCEIESRLTDIVRWDNYQTMAGLRVYRAMRTLQAEDLPCVVLWEDTESADNADGNHASMTVTLSFSVEGHMAANLADTGMQLGRIKADIKRALLRGNGALGDALGVIGVLTYTDADSDSRNDGAMSEAVALHFTLTYKEAYGDPAKAR